MPKPIINNEQSDLKFDTKSILEERSKCKSPELAFRKQRPEEYVNLLKDLDIEGQTMSSNKIREIVDGIKNACPEIVLGDTFIGIFGKCRLGCVYDVHTLSINKGFGLTEVTHLPGYGRLILKHYLRNETLPEGLEKARALACNKQYVFVEVYTDKLIAVGHNGKTAIIEV